MALTPAQLAYRSTRIGGSDAAALCGKDPHKTAYAVALRITGQVESDDLSELDHIWFGDQMEVVLANMYERKEKVKVYTPDTLKHPHVEFMIANVDRLREDRADLGIECKNTGLHAGTVDETERWGEVGTDEVPDRVNIQCQHAMLVHEPFKAFHVLRCYGGNTYQRFIVPRNEKLIEALYELEQDFMSDLRRGVLPAPDYGHRTTKETLKRAFRNINGEVTNLDHIPDLEAVTAEWQAVCKVRLDAQKKEEALKNRITHLVGDFGAVLMPNGKMWRRKEIERDGYTVEPTKYIECRLVNQK